MFANGVLNRVRAAKAVQRRAEAVQDAKAETPVNQNKFKACKPLWVTGVFILNLLTVRLFAPLLWHCVNMFIINKK